MLAQLHGLAPLYCTYGWRQNLIYINFIIIKLNLYSRHIYKRTRKEISRCFQKNDLKKSYAISEGSKFSIEISGECPGTFLKLYHKYSMVYMYVLVYAEWKKYQKWIIHRKLKVATSEGP